MPLAGCGAETADDDASSSPLPGDDDASPAAGSDDPSSPVLMISDGGNYKVQLLRPDTRSVFYELDLTQRFEECNGGDSFCALTEVHHVVHDGQDFLDMNLGQVDTSGNPANPATIRRVRMNDTVDPVFTLRELDFSGLATGSDICDYDPADPCKPGKSPLCSLIFPHDLDVLVDDPANHYAELLVADLLAQRIMKIDLDYSNGNTCGRVEWSLDRYTAGWGDLYMPNDADYFEQDGAQYLLTSFYSTSQIIGTGFIAMWKRGSSTESWRKIWTYPDPASSEMPYMNTPHGPVLVPQNDGSLLMRYGHSRADASWWRTGYQGALGAARLESLDSPPVYLYESVFPDGSWLTPTGFIRDVEPTADGRWLVSDSGCEMYFNCPLEGRVYLIEPEPYTPAEGLSGAWTNDRSQQNFALMEGVDPFVCGFSTVYESDYLTLGELGDDLRPRWKDDLADCPLPSAP